MKILKLRIHNFKIFADTEIDFSDSNSLILCGRNGYGKTSVFDALELLFTGKIKRYEDYGNNYHDKRWTLYGKPLVHDKNVTDLFIEASIQMNDGSMKNLKIEGDVENIGIPVDFVSVFHKEGPAFDMPEIRSLCKHYTRVNYLSQDESTEYLKQNEKDRSKQIELLFKTDCFDDLIKKISKAKKGLEGVCNAYTEKKDHLQAAIDALNTKIEQSSQEVKSEMHNIRLFGENSIAWDVDTPSLSSNEIEGIIQQDGELDHILYFIRHSEEYHSLIRNNKIRHIVQPERLHQIAFYYKFHTSDGLFNQYGNFKNGYLRYYNNLTIENISSNHLPPVESLPIAITNKERNALENLRKGTADILLSSTRLQQVCNRLLDNRRQVGRDLNETDFNHCPVCGTDFNTKESLIAHINQYDEEFLRASNLISKNSSDTFSKFKDSLREQIIDKVKKYFMDNHITEELYSEYDTVKNISSTEDYNLAMRIVDNSLSSNLSLEELEERMLNTLQDQVRPVDNNIDIELLQQVATRYGKYLLEHIKEENIEQKRIYLLTYQWKICIQQKRKDSKEQDKYNNLIRKCNEYKDHLKSVEDNIKEQRDQYIGHVVSDIEVLFYIYSGRIMQDSYYGRGIFLKRSVTNSQVSRILFVCGDYSNDVDVLYNMSSGQLISIAIAFLLALNKLYDKADILAIDDPVQTIDDINLWGLIETIRHEFGNKNILLSTHEDDSAAWIRYKLEMMGRKAFALDMRTLNNKKYESEK
jgi:ABC-type Mn2+/Zn2+ transport system ATPase subunit